MTLPRAVAALLAALVAATVLPMTGTTSAIAADSAEPSPLAVTLTRLTPSTIPAKGHIVLAGTVRNDSTEPWTAINVHPLFSTSPMTDRDQLAAAAASDPAAEVGTRLVGDGQFAAIGDLLPGQSTSFRISLKVKQLGLHTPGVYWIGVQALGAHQTGRGMGGQARTFIPLVPEGVQSSVALVVPLRERVRRDRTGKLLDTTAWSDSLGDDGRLERIAALLDKAGGVPTTMLVDPAVIDAVGSIAADNPALSLGAKPAPSPSPSPSAGASGTDVPASRSLDRLGPDDRANATRWLAQVKTASTWLRVLSLGYADPDVAALAHRRPQLVTVAAKTSETAFKALGISAVPAAAPADGWLDDEALSAIPSGTMVLVSDHSAPRTRTHWRTPKDQDLVFTDEQASSGGPGPTPPFDALAVRQRIVSDAALRAAEDATSPMVVDLPAHWDPGANWQTADFFGGLDLPWLDLVPLDRAPESTPVFDAALGYPAAERKSELGLANMTAAHSLISTASVMGQLLRSTNDVKQGLTGLALESVSLHARRDPRRASDGVLSANSAMRDQLAKVAVIGTDLSTLSGGSGTLTVTLVNGLDQPVTVGVQPHTTSRDVRIQAPKPLDLAPGQRSVLRLHATASSIGVHEVTLTPVTANGTALGTPLTFTLRSSEVGKLIWAVLAGGGGLLVVMILRRIRRGLREHRWRGQ